MFVASCLQMNKKISGFTLVELAVVMIIIGLLLAGVLKGQAMVRNAEIKKLVATVDMLRTGARTFQDKYGSLPGDLVNAQTRIPGCAAMAECLSVGDGNGIIGTPRVDDWSMDDQSAIDTEATQFWVHMAMADLIHDVAPANGPVWGGFYPSSPMGGGFHVIHAEEPAPNRANGHYFVLRFPPTGSAHVLAAGNAVLTPAVAARLESEYDDNSPNSGAIIADDAAGLCWDTVTGRYIAGSEEAACLIAFRFLN